MLRLGVYRSFRMTYQLDEIDGRWKTTPPMPEEMYFCSSWTAAAGKQLPGQCREDVSWIYLTAFMTRDGKPLPSGTAFMVVIHLLDKKPDDMSDIITVTRMQPVPSELKDAKVVGPDDVRSILCKLQADWCPYIMAPEKEKDGNTVYFCAQGMAHMGMLGDEDVYYFKLELLPDMPVQEPSE